MTLAHWLRPAAAPTNARKSPPTSRLSIECLEDRTTPSSGGLLDPTFGTGGYATTPFTPSEHVYAVAVQPDGRVLAAGDGRGSTYDFFLTRYNADGSLDTTFGSGGRVTTDFSKGDDRVYAVSVQPGTGGKILVAGRASVGSGLDFGIARYNPNGTLDTTFGSRGKVTLDFSHSADQVFSMAALPDGKFVLAGTTGGKIGLARFNANGSLDKSFGSGGKAVGPAVGGSSIRPREVSLAVDGGGRLVVAGGSPNQVEGQGDFLVARFLPTGQPDQTFGAGGVVRTDVAPGTLDGASSVAVQSDGQILVAGGATYTTTYNGGMVNPDQYALVRYNPDGSLDGSFGTGGVVTAVPDLSQVSSGYAAGVVVRPDGSIIVGGTVGYTGQTSGPGKIGVAVLRFDAAGNRDLSFGTPGVGGTATLVAGSNIHVKDMTVQPDGRVVVGGTFNDTDPLLARYLVSAPQVGSFTATSSSVAPGDSLTLTASGITDGNPSGTVNTVEFYYFDGAGTKQLLGTGTQTSAGIWTLAFTVSLPPGSYTLYARAIDGFGAVGDPISLTLTVV